MFFKELFLRKFENLRMLTWHHFQVKLNKITLKTVIRWQETVQ